MAGKLRDVILTTIVLCTALPGQGRVPSARLPADTLLGPPFVTSRSWAIVDASSGEFLWGKAEDKVRPMASLTKVMTAYVVLKLAKKDASVLHEEVRVSRFAANTGGSSAKLRQGDRIPVGQMLYGLLLPSGNDAANALAEHFGREFKPPQNPQTQPWTVQSSGRSPAWSNFVAEMNRQARRLRMQDTHYVNPHGLDARGHQSTARDILRVARAAMTIPFFRKVVNTRRLRVKFPGGDGRSRLLAWANTNQLLAVEGFLGVKTGTTPRAGYCLASCAERGGDRLLLVVLDAANRDGRYVDTRNLFRWAFTQRLAGGR